MTGLITRWEELESLTRLTREDIRHKMIAEDFPLPRTIKTAIGMRSGWNRQKVEEWLDRRGITAPDQGLVQGSSVSPDLASKHEAPR